MTPPQAKRIVLVGLVVAGGVAAGAQVLESKRPPLRIAIGVAGAAVVLGALAEVAPKVAATLAIALASSAVFVTGAPVWDKAAGVVARKEPS